MLTVGRCCAQGRGGPGRSWAGHAWREPPRRSKTPPTRGGSPSRSSWTAWASSSRALMSARSSNRAPLLMLTSWRNSSSCSRKYSCSRTGIRRPPHRTGRTGGPPCARLGPGAIPRQGCTADRAAGHPASLNQMKSWRQDGGGLRVTWKVGRGPGAGLGSGFAARRVRRNATQPVREPSCSLTSGIESAMAPEARTGSAMRPGRNSGAGRPTLGRWCLLEAPANSGKRAGGRSASTSPPAPGLPHRSCEASLAVAPLTVLLDPLGDRDPHVRDGDPVVGEPQLGVVDQVADNPGAGRVWPADPEYGISGAVGDRRLMRFARNLRQRHDSRLEPSGPSATARRAGDAT